MSSTSQKTSNNPYILLGAAIVFLLIGVGLLIGLFVQYTQQQAFASTALSAIGTVTEVQTYIARSSGNSTASYAPVIDFSTSEGKNQTFTASASSSPSYKVGDQVEILYDPANPTEAVIAAETLARNPSTFLFIGIGVVFIAVALILLRGLFVKWRAA